MTKMAVRAIHGQNFEKKIQTRNSIILQLHLGIGNWELMVCKVSIHGDNALNLTYVTASPGSSVVEHPIREREVVG